MNTTDWAKERAEFEAEMKKEADELRAILAEAKRDKSLDPKKKRIMLDAGEKLLGEGGFLKGVLDLASEVCGKCETWEKKLRALEDKPQARRARSARARAAKTRR